MNKDAMTMIELEYVLGNKIRGIENAKNGEEREIAIEDAKVITSVAKQFINGGKLILEAEKLQAQIGILTSSKAHALIGE